MAAVAFTPSDTEQQLRKNLAQSIDLVVMTNIEDLVQSSNLGSQSSFEPLRPVFQKTMALFQLLSAANLDCVTETQLKRLANAAARMRNEFDQLKGFAPNQYPHRQSKIDSMIARYEEVFLEIAPVMGVSQHARLEDDVSQVRDLTRALEEKHRQFDSYKAETEKQLADILSKAKEITEKVGISEHAAHFSNESREHKTAARVWLFITVLLALGTGFLAWVNYGRTFALLEGTAPGHDPLPTGAFVQLAIAKFIIFSILFSAVLWAGRIYRAHRHNYVVNKHRQNALSTFEAFAQAASGDPETKNAILLQATQCIFSPQTTGYLGQEKESDGHTSILEVIRNMPSSKA